MESRRSLTTAFESRRVARHRKRVLLAVCLLFVVSQSRLAAAPEQTQKAAAAESKAEILEQKAAAGAANAPPAQSEIITKSETQAVDPAGEEPLDEAITCLARTIYWETRGEDVASMEAVANVVMNRLGSAGFPDTICAVVRQGGERGSCQFSWWCDGRSDDAEDAASYATAKEVARKALNRQLSDRTGGALYFHHRKATPNWAMQYIRTARVGEHVFYKPHGGAAE